MIWYQCIAFLTAWIAVLLVVFEVYAWMLRCIARFYRPIKYTLSIFACCSTLTIAFSPLFCIQFITELFWPSNAVTRFVAAMIIMECQFFAIAFFYNRHMPILKSLGYF